MTTQFGKTCRIGSVSQSFGVQHSQLGVDPTGAHGVLVTRPHEHESWWCRQACGNEFAKVGSLAAGLLGIGDSQRSDIADVGVVVHEPTICHGGRHT